VSTLRVGIATLEQYKARTMAIASGNYVPAGNEPKVWVQSLETLSQVLLEKNKALLAAMATTEPKSLMNPVEETGCL
jgi:predicted transcriptional regulator